ncbi:putative mitogen-activated protein kinase 14C [Drosophila subpulchrella]|uniref:putative mitogen-activated protein kinase 14C n=1 Tax=Drosophila subpulchrella TaxID=1486046 RepID=UPI0018A1A0DA|nr:putative mitogen-activated protein kinase 14C [Drosophila subpulchrella]
MAGFARVEVNQSVWEFPDVYEMVRPLGMGSFGQVARVRLRGGHIEDVAMKKLVRPFEREEDAKGAYRELRLLKHMNHRNVVSLLQVFHPPPQMGDFQNVYFVTQLMDEDLHRFARSSRITEYQIRSILYQILRGLKYIHSAGVIHRDLKPCNIAVNQNIEVRILDFGLARLSSNIMTDLVGTLWYRAPELLFLRDNYTNRIDMWSVGCILAELISGHTLFPGDHYFNQLVRLLEIMGSPSEEFTRGIRNEKSRNYLERYPYREKNDFYQMFPNANPLAVDLMEKMLEMVPEKRITADEAMHHPFLKDFIEPHHRDEDIAPAYDQNFENVVLSVNCWKELLSHEIDLFQPPPFYAEALRMSYEQQQQ